MNAFGWKAFLLARKRNNYYIFQTFHVMSAIDMQEGKAMVYFGKIRFSMFCTETLRLRLYGVRRAVADHRR
jgi:hypothetical protein